MPVFRTIARKLGGHYHVDVFVADREDQTFANTGTLVMDHDDYVSFRESFSAQHFEHVEETVLTDELEEAKDWATKEAERLELGPIQGFTGAYRFLSNFWPANVTYEGVVYPTVENAYQASKFPKEDRKPFETCKPAEAKSHGKKAHLTEEWKARRYNTMYQLNKQKYALNPHLRELLVSTRDRYIEETNHWGDTYWGVCKGVGENHLGRLLMNIRDDLKTGEAP